MITHAFTHALEDSAKMLPFLFAAYLIIELLERRRGATIEKWLSRGGRFGFVPAAALGLFPQCGFSAMAANFYGSRVISLGTLMAVFIATSDEAIPVMLAQPDSYGAMLILLLTKFLYALLVGFVLDILLVRLLPSSLRGGYAGNVQEIDCHHHEEHRHWLTATLLHTATTFAIILVFTFGFGLLVEGLGEERISGYLGGLGLLQPLMAGLFGLIPNCASSVLLTQLYLEGAISFGSVLAGLSCNAGIGLTVLFRTNRSLRQNLFILAMLYVLGSVLGLVVHWAAGLFAPSLL
ncbi:arsenic efflux protein [Ruminococcaceae bacterium OttesenSCG-928-I18]|nr:arsenic efflux protein [Ruminococcaceae bacterium OttesenSCG-928-I18]